jgi:pantothenate kinase-related protein Tda10
MKHKIISPERKIIAFSGAQATGKTTAALEVVRYLKINGHNAIFVGSASSTSVYLTAAAAKDLKSC